MTSFSSPFEVGAGGAGYIWSPSEGRKEEWRHSVAPIPADKLADLRKAYDDLDLTNLDVNPTPNLDITSDPDTEDPMDDFEKEVTY